RRQAETGDWRPAIDGLRPHVQAIWRDWSHVERTRFLRHLRPWWDVHRHRLAPPVAQRIDHLTAAGVLSTCAGRIVSMERSGDGLKVIWTARGRREPIETAAALVVNCTGPNSNLAASTDPLIASLSRQGLIRPDPYKLGAEVNPKHQLIGADGRANPRLYAVGPMTRGSVWEITSVPDIRVQAAQCAAGLVERAAVQVG
ncbi:MAG: FAD/NAD(P)-binding protein, partial [Caulobacteraceae bacterium]